MAFKKFTKVGGRSFAPKVGIWSKGQIGFNKGAIEKFELNQYDYVMLYFDEEEKKIGFEFTNDASAEGVIKIIKRPTGFSFSANSFLKHYEITPEENVKYDVIFDKEQKLYIIELKTDLQK